MSKVILFIFLSYCSLLPFMPAAQADDAAVSASTGLPLPRFVSLRSAETNVRTGPGERYPVRWVLKHKAMPVEIIAEYETWRKIRDWQGSEGWVHQALLWGRRSAVVHPTETVLRADPSPVARPVARLAANVIGMIESCDVAWCHFNIDSTEGWVSKTALWGVYPDEVIK